MPSPSGWLLRWQLRVRDYLRTHDAPRVKHAAALPRAFFGSDLGRVDACANFLMSSFLMPHPGRQVNSVILRHGLRTATRYVRSTRAQSPDPITLRRTIVLKQPVDEAERGVLLVLFETELMKLMHSAFFREIERRYQIIFLPTWQPFFTAAVLLLAARATQDFFLMPSGFWESALCQQLSPRCHALPFHAASWVNEALYQKTPKKDIDILVVANFMSYKRHWKLFEAIVAMPKDLVISLAGVPIGRRTRGAVLKEARAFGVEDRVTIYDTLSDEALADLAARAKIMCALSHREGPYVAVAEALMAGVPVGMYANAMIGTSAYINNQTGVFFSPKEKLSHQISEFLERSGEFSPGQWARANISATKNSERLNALLRQHAISRGERWTRDIERFYAVRFVFRYYDDGEARFTNVYEELRRSFRVTIERPHRRSPMPTAASSSPPDWEQG